MTETAGATAVHAALAGTDWDDLAQQARDAMTEVDDLPLGNGPESRLERTLWGLGPAIVHDRIVERCSEPSRDDAQQCRDEFSTQPTEASHGSRGVWRLHNRRSEIASAGIGGPADTQPPQVRGG